MTSTMAGESVDAAPAGVSGDGSTAPRRDFFTPAEEPAEPLPSGPAWAVVVVVGVWHLLLAILAVVVTFSWWPLVEQSASGNVTLRWHSLDFTLTVFSGALLLGVVGGVVGSLVHTIAIFSSRVGRNKFEASFLWWYLLRPFGAALLALLFVAAVQSGMLALSGDNGGSQAAAAFIAGGLAGLFTDAVLQRLRGILGATSTEQMASEQAVPLAPPPQTRTTDAVPAAGPAAN